MFLFLYLIYSISTLDALTLLLTTHLTLQLGSLYYSLKFAEEVIFQTILFFFLNIYLFMAVLGLCFCVRAFSSCGKRGPLFIAVHGPLTVAASLAAEHRLQTRRLSSCGSWA